MATRDLSYLISFDVTDATSLSEAATAMDELNTAAGGLAESSPEIDLGLGGIEDLPSQIDDVGGALDDLPVEESTSRWGGLRDVMGEFGLASIGVGEAIEIASTAIDVGRQAWDFFTADARAAEQRTRDFAAALLEASGAISSIESTFKGNDDPFNAFTEALLNLGDVDLATVVTALGDVGLQASDLGQTLIEIGTTDSVVRQFQDMAAAAGVLTSEWVPVIELGGSGLVVALGDASEAQQEFIQGFNVLAGSLDGLDFEDIARQQLDVAEGYDAMAVAQARLELGPDASDIDVWVRYQENVTAAAEATEEQAAAAAELAAQQRALTIGARELTTALGSIEWQNAELAGATTAMSQFSDSLFAVDNATQSVEEAFASFVSAVGDDPLNFDVTTEAGRRQQDALEGVANALDTQFVQAFDAANGSQEAFIASATEIGDATLARLQDELDLSTEQVDALRTALGLTEGDYEARFELSADETAIQRLQLLQGAIAGLPEEVSTTVNTLIAAGDPQEALDVIIAFYSDPANTAMIETDVDPAGAQANLATIADSEYVVEFDTEADVSSAEAALAALPQSERVIPVRAEAETEQAAVDVNEFVEGDRTITTSLGLRNGSEFDELVGLHTADQTITVDLVTGTITLPTAAALAAMIGTVRVPIDAYVRNVERISGSRVPI